MNDEKLTARELFQIYKRQYDELVNMYCQARDNHPFEKYPQMTRAIWRVGMLVDTWRRIVIKNLSQRHQGE